jgi:serine/threonine-protein kinase
VIITPQGRAKIADFGIARTENSGLTMAHSVLGTPMYMAPEQFTGRSIDHRVDLYATGVLLYQLVAGRPPFVGSPEVLMYKVVNDVAPPPSTVEGEARTVRFDALALRALAKDPAQRFAGAQAFRQALAEALGQPLATALSPEVVLTAGDAYAPTERIPTGMSTNLPTGTGMTGEPPTHFEANDLAAVEAALARHVGPMAKVLVRRTARQCQDLAELHQRLAEQITNVAAREAFLGRASKSGPGTGGTHGTGGTGVSGASARTNTGVVGTTAFTAPIGLGSLPVSDAWLEQATKLLLAQVGPIAKVMVRRAAERSRVREVLVQEFAAAVPDAQRSKLVAELNKLA